MAYQKPKRRGRRERPGFEKPKKGGGFPWWILAVLAVVILVFFGAFRLIKGPATQATETPTLTPVSTETPTLAPPTDTPTPPSPTPTPETRACTVEEDTRIYREPNTVATVINQNLSIGSTVHVIEQVTANGATWYKALLPGDDVPWYVAIDAVGCE